MKTLIIYVYMLIFHPIIFFRRTLSTKLLIKKNCSISDIKKLHVGKNVVFGNDTRISFFTDSKLRIGNDSYIVNRTSFLVGGEIKIGNNVLIASDVCVISENHSMDPLNDKNYMDQDLINQQVRIEDGCWIGEKAIILPGTVIGSKSIIGAGSVVTKSIPPLSLAVGNPAKVIKVFNIEKKEWEYVS